MCWENHRSARNGLEAVSLFGSAAIEFQQVGVKAVAARTAVTSGICFFS
jgi:hypothetical protein